MIRAYGSKSLHAPRRGGRPWKRFLLLFVVGFIGGIIADQALTIRTPVELTILAPSQGVPVIQSDGQALSEVWSDSGNISVRTPQSNAIIANPLIVEGMERVFEQTVALRLRDGKGVEIIKTSVIGSAPDAGIHGPYRAELKFDIPKTKTGTLEVFQVSAKDGSEIDMITVPVRFQ